MVHRARTTTSLSPSTALAAMLAIVGAALASLVLAQAPVASSSAAPGVTSPREAPTRASEEANGVLPDGTTAFADLPGVADLEPDLLAALRRAATDAGRDGNAIVVESGWRSEAYQERLLREAISRYGSEAEAARWVATPATSPHVAGEAVDLGPADAADWLATHGATYGLCRIYRNEPWHFELRGNAVDHGCPPMYADPTHDPRMQR